MKLKIFYNYIEEDNRHFKMGIVDSEGNLCQNEAGIKAVINFEDEDDSYYFDEPFEYLTEVFDKCVKNSRGKWGSTPYDEQNVYFLSLYNSNFAEINKNTSVDIKRDIEKQVEALQQKLRSLEATLKHSEDDFINCDGINSQEIERLNTLYLKWIAEEELKLRDVVEGSETYNKIQETITKHKSKIYEAV